MDSLEQLAAAAAARGYACLAVTDHAEGLAVNGMSREAVRARRRALAEVQQRHPRVRFLDAAELNIGLEGGLDCDRGFLLGWATPDRVPNCRDLEGLLAFVARKR